VWVGRSHQKGRNQAEHWSSVVREVDRQTRGARGKVMQSCRSPGLGFRRVWTFEQAGGERASAENIKKKRIRAGENLEKTYVI